MENTETARRSSVPFPIRTSLRHIQCIPSAKLSAAKRMAFLFFPFDVYISGACVYIILSRAVTADISAILARAGQLRIEISANGIVVEWKTGFFRQAQCDRPRCGSTWYAESCPPASNEHSSRSSAFAWLLPRSLGYSPYGRTPWRYRQANLSLPFLPYP